MAPRDTKQRILDAAEALFAERGYGGASLREITSRARANLAAANYHFGSKEDLLRAVFERRFDDLNAERLRRLDALERGDEPARLEEAIEVFVGPALELGRDREHGGAHFVRIVGRAHSDTEGPMRAVVEGGVFDEVRRRFCAAFSRLLPELDEADILWRVHFAVGAMVHTILHAETIRSVSAGRCDAGDHDAVLRHLSAFLTGALRAPSARRGPRSGSPQSSKRSASKRRA